MKIVISGGDGQLGRALAACTAEHQYVPLGRRQMDIVNEHQVAEVLDRERPDVVVNCAAYTRVDEAENDQSTAYMLNENGPAILAKQTCRLNIPLLHVSTDYVFDGLNTLPYNETDSPNPTGVYGRSKLAGERAVALHNPRHFIVRTAWLYHYHGKNFPTTMMSLADRDEVRVVDDQRGSPTYAPHLADALLQVIATGTYGVWHMAGAGNATWYEFTCALYELAGIHTMVVPVGTEEFPRHAPRPAYSVLTDSRNISIGLPPWRQGLAEFVKRRGSHLTQCQV